MHKMFICAGLIVYLTFVSGDTGSNSYVYGSGGIGGVGQVQLQSHSVSQYQNGLPSALAHSVNNGSSSSVSVHGQATGGLNVNYVNDHIPNQVITGISNANSYGNAATGQLTNNDHSTSDNTNGLTLHGHSQITGNGTGVSISSSADSNVVKCPITTTPPWNAHCSYSEAWCTCPCIISGGDACICPYNPMVINAPQKTALVARGRQSVGRQRQRNLIKNSLTQRALQRPGSLRRPLTSMVSNARKRS